MIELPSRPRLPKHVTFENTSACNLRCFMCEHHRPEVFNKRDLMRADTFERVLDEIRDEVSIVSLTTTGEPFVDANVDRKLALLGRDPRIAIEIVTNGAMLDEERFAFMAGMQNHIYLSVSLDSVDPDVYRSIRSPGELAPVMDNLTRMTGWARDHGIPNFHLGIGMVMMRRNIGGIIPLIETASACGADRVGLSHVTLFEPWRDRMDSLFTMRAEGNALIAAGKQRGAELGLTVYAPPAMAITAEEIAAYENARVTSCPYLEGRVYVGHDGKVEACCHNKRPIMGSVEGRTLADVWKSAGYRFYREGLAASRPPSPCGDCYVLEFYKPYLHDTRPFGLDIDAGTMPAAKEVS